MGSYKQIFTISIWLFLWHMKDADFRGKQPARMSRIQEAFRCEYIMETTPLPYDTALTFSAQMRVQWTVITNGRLYMVIGKLESMTMAGQVMAENQDADTLLIDSHTNTCFSFKDKTAAESDTFHIEDGIVRTGNNGRYVLVDTKDSVSVYMDTVYQKFLTPFPQVKGNRYGITKLKSPYQVCSLQSITRQDFDFEPFLLRSSSFRKSEERIPLPFL